MSSLQISLKMVQEINQFNLNAGILNKYKSIFYYNTFWHQIVVENVEGLDRDAVLRTILKFCLPLHFIPVHYTSNNNIATFLLKNCGAAIQKLCEHNLIIINPFNSEKPFKITIKLCYASSNDLKINIHLNLTAVLNKRFNKYTGVLNLENFAKDAELEEYCPLSQPKLFFYILHLAKNFQFKVLKLANNDIESLQPMDGLDNFKTPISVDLRNNNIKDIAEIDNMKHLHITELWLDGNPICDNYNEITYGKEIREHMEKLEKLDGINVSTKGFLPFRRNFLCNLTGFDLVDQFLDHYFTLYDAQNRSLLEELYNKDAFFSLTSMYIPGQTTSATAILSHYKKASRNLKHISDFSKSSQYLCLGPYQIIQMLTSLPVTEHDPFSFAADLIMYTDTTAVLVVSGVFRESAVSLLESDRLLGFSRTFVLLAGPNSEYSIINEMLNITNATNIQAMRAFKRIRLPKPNFIQIPQPQNEKEQLEMVEALMVITGMVSTWSRKCLDDSKFDFKEALNLFIKLYKTDKIPKFALMSDQDKRDLIARLKNAPTSAKSSRETIQQRIVEPTVGIVGRRSAASFLNNISTANQGSLSPDHIWDKFSSSDKKNYEQPLIQDDLMEVIDLASSPDDELLTNSSNHPEDDGAVVDYYQASSSAPFNERHLKKVAAPPIVGIKDSNKKRNAPANTGGRRSNVLKLLQVNKRKSRKSQRNAFQSEFEAFQVHYAQEGFESSIDNVLSILKRNALALEVFEIVFDWFYADDVNNAREFKRKVYSMAETSKMPFLNVVQLDLIVARCEYLYGNEKYGEDEFKKLMMKRHAWARPISQLCRAMVQKNQLDRAKALIKPIITTNHPLKAKMIRIVRLIECEYDVTLLD